VPDRPPPFADAVARARLRAELARAVRERDAAIRRQVHSGDSSLWFVADGVRVEDGERLGPFPSEAEAMESVLAWIKWALDPENVAMPEYRLAEEEIDP
jgi:hypothetical protein